jgi:hypothetical protein
MITTGALIELIVDQVERFKAGKTASVLFCIHHSHYPGCAHSQLPSAFPGSRSYSSPTPSKVHLEVHGHMSDTLHHH